MRKFSTIFTVAAALAISMSSCSSLSSFTGANGNASATDIVGSFVGGLMADNVKLSEKNIQGNWKYQKPACRFKSENMLAQAGGSVASANVEKQLESTYQKLGIRKGNCYFTFNSDHTCDVKMGSIAFKGKYTYNSSNSSVTISSNTGLVHLTGYLFADLGGITMVFDGKKLLSVIQAVGMFAGNSNSTIATLSQLMNQYDGLQIGFNLKK